MIELAHLSFDFNLSKEDLLIGKNFKAGGRIFYKINNNVGFSIDDGISALSSNAPKITAFISELLIIHP